MSELRQLKHDFLACWDRDTWPKVTAMQQWLRERKARGTGNDGHTALRNGRPTSTRYVRAFLQYVTRDTESDSLDEYAQREWGIVSDYLKARGCDHPESMSVDHIVPAISDVVKQHRGNQVVDWFAAPVESIASIYTRSRIMKRDPWTAVKLCDNDNPRRTAQINEAIRWIYICLGRDIKNFARLPLDEAIEASERFLGISMADFQDQAAAWCEYSRWTIVRCYDGKRLTGAMITLPLNGTAYQQTRDGLRSSFRFGPKDMCQFSPNLLSLAMAPRSDGAPTARSAFSHSALPAIVCQQARLSTVPEIGAMQPLRILAPAGTKMNTALLRCAGYRKTGTFVYDLPTMPYMERHFSILSDGIKKTTDAKMYGSWIRLQHDLVRVEASGELS